MTNINVFYAKALTSVVVPPGTNLGGRIATDRFSYGFQVFEINGDEEVIVLNDGTTTALSGAKWNRHQMFAELADAIYRPVEEKVVEPAPTENEPVGMYSGFKQWDNTEGVDFPPELNAADEVEVIFRDAGRDCDTVEAYNWDTSGGHYDIVMYRLTKKVVVEVPEIGVDPDMAPWNGDVDQYPDGVDPLSKVVVQYRDGVIDSGRAMDFTWCHYTGSPNSEIVGYKVTPEEPEWQESTSAPEAPVPEKKPFNPDEIEFGPITDVSAEESGFQPIDSVWDFESTVFGRITAFRFADGHVVVAKEGHAFWRRLGDDASTFRPLKDYEQIVSVRVYPESAFFNNHWHVIDGMPVNVNIMDIVRIHFVCGRSVTKTAFEVDWGRVGDPKNDVVAYEFVGK